MSGTAPAVSVVIPTFERPDLVPRAVRSALAQTLTDLEVIVVVDGGDRATREALGELVDPRLSVHVPARHLGNADARNAGVERARAPWVAFLDDDDVWLPAKLERQLATALASSSPRPIVCCRILARAESGERVWPRRLPEPGEDWSEYLFCRRTPFTGEGMVILSAIIAPRELLRRVPFASGLARHVDPDWLLRAASEDGVGLEFVADPEPLVVWHIESGRRRITTVPDWEASLEWCRRSRSRFSARGYAAFVLHVVSSAAAAQHAWRAWPLLAREAFAAGRPAPVDLAAHCANFALPAGVLERGAAWWARRLRQRQAASA